MKRVKLEKGEKPKKRKRAPRPSDFQKGHRLSVGNKGPERKKAKQRARRFVQSAIEHAMENHSGLDSAGRSLAAYKLMKNLIDIGLSKDKQAVNAIKEAFDRAIGKSVQAVELTGRDGKPIQTVTREMPLKEAMKVLQTNMDFVPNEDEDEENDV